MRTVSQERKLYRKVQSIERRLTTLEHRTDGLCESPDRKQVMTVPEAAAFLGISVSGLYKLTAASLIPHYKPRKKNIYFYRPELEKWALSCRTSNNLMP